MRDWTVPQAEAVSPMRTAAASLPVAADLPSANPFGEESEWDLEEHVQRHRVTFKESAPVDGKLDARTARAVLLQVGVQFACLKFLATPCVRRLDYRRPPFDVSGK
jgi:hypothetical protein